MAEKKLQGQVAIITGGGRGIGKAAAEQLAALGATVVVVARSQEQVEQVASALRKQGNSAIGIAADVSKPQEVDRIITSTLAQAGRVDIIVNNAAVIWPVEEVSKSDVEAWAYAIQVNLLGSFYFVRYALPVMLKQHYGRIVNVSSGAAINPIVGASAYSTSKAGMDMLTRATAQELLDSGVTINSFHPGMVDTGMQVDLRSVDTTDSRFSLARFHDAYEQGQLRSPQDVARAITWLAGPWSSKQNGQVFRIADEDWLRQVNSDLNQ
jgi:NAD(P)-dependent dehydrogenase (short-subunit alcohol dehydrogenase family)